MAYCDYQHCKVCDCKVFYDEGDGNPMSVVSLCKACFETHEIVVRPRVADETERGET